MAAGWTPDAQTQEEYERLRLSPHQLTIPTARDPGELRRGDWRGWVLVAEEPLPPSAVGRLEEGLSTIVGADSHLGLLDRLAPAPPEAPPLTTRERMILTLLAQGRTAAAIASRLAISPRTVHKHQEHLYRKLGAVDRLSAVLAGQRLGLLPAPPLLDPVPEGSVRDRALTPSAAACSLPRPGRA
ncbi:helix-turn-helix transcriptional regulator [Ornithinimicrobium kibberense]|uniref:helix-turn-helix transcriptional regulator n=1 Tax=Ornithinimicrobium kibberense TaxID=282060 RepID=UPI003607806E